MAKFNVLQYNQRQMCELGIYSRGNETITKRHKIQAVFICLILFAQASVVIQSICKLCDGSIEFVDKIDLFQVVISVTQAVSVYLNMRFNVENIASLIAHLQTFVDTEGLHLINH